MHNFTTLQEANEFIKQNGKEKLQDGDLRRIHHLAIAEMEPGGRRRVELIERTEANNRNFEYFKNAGLRRGLSEADAIRYAETMCDEPGGDPSRDVITDGQHSAGRRSASSSVRNMGTRHNGSQEESITEAKPEEIRARKETFNHFKQMALRRGKTEAQAVRYAEICCGAPAGHIGSRGKTMSEAEKMEEQFLRLPGMTPEKAKIAASLP